MAIFVYNREKEMFDGENNYRIYRPYLLGNPYTHIKNRETKAMYLVNSREEAIQKYSHYFDIMYQTNLGFRDVVDEMYEKYKNGEDIYLQCFCKPLPCHCDIIADRLQRKLIKEKLEDRKRLKNNKS